MTGYNQHNAYMELHQRYRPTFRYILSVLFPAPLGSSCEYKQPLALVFRQFLLTNSLHGVYKHDVILRIFIFRVALCLTVVLDHVVDSFAFYVSGARIGLDCHSVFMAQSHYFSSKRHLELTIFPWLSSNWIPLS